MQQATHPMNHIALIEDYAGNHLLYANDGRVNDNHWHNVSVDVQQLYVRVFVDGGLVLQYYGQLNETYDGFGFSGATGDDSDWHIIDNVSITAPSNLTAPTDKQNFVGQYLVAPEYSLGTVAATLACFAALAFYKKTCHKTH